MHGEELKYVTEAYETNWMSTVGNAGGAGFMGRIMEGVEFMYSKAADELPVDKGEYVGKTYTSGEIVDSTIADQVCPNDDAILEDIRSAVFPQIPALTARYTAFVHRCHS